MARRAEPNDERQPPAVLLHKVSPVFSAYVLEKMTRKAAAAQVQREGRRNPIRRKN
jgi:hypothetical protein